MKIATMKSGARDWRKAATELAKATVGAIPLLVAGQPGASLAALAAAMPPVIEAAVAVSSRRQSLGSTAWTVIRSAYAAAVARFIAVAPLDRRPAGAELKALVEHLIVRLELTLEAEEQELSVGVFHSPLRLRAFRKIAKDIPDEFRLFTLTNPIANARRLFEECLIEGFSICRNLMPEDFSKVEGALKGPFADGQGKYKSLANHYSFLFHAFSMRPIFGQEETGITLSDLYVRQRAISVSRESNGKGEIAERDTIEFVGSDFFRNSEKAPHKWRYLFHIDDLHNNLRSWLETRRPDDAIRVIGGGPGSGKSTFARAFAIEVIDSGQWDVLFIPLQEIEATGSFPVRVENLLRARSDLGLDKNPDALTWLGQTEGSETTPDRPLLLVCDGLDEIALPGSAEAATVTADFVQALNAWVSARNSGGHHVCALVLGRTISAQEAFDKLGIAHHALVRVAGLLPISQTEEWQKAERHKCVRDEHKLAGEDQRQKYWELWSRANDLNSSSLPAALQANNAAGRALQDLTAEPLLLYLLLWTGYLVQHWEKAADNRNHVYEEIFGQIYKRKWGGEARPSRNRERGGHPGTHDVTEDEFLLLQEALGLASWSSGGRTVNTVAFASMLRTYLDDDKFEDLSESVSASLKSVALQGYTRSVGGDAAGYEFVHKTIGEYLIARGLATTIISALDEVREKVTPIRCAKVAAKLAAIMWHGPLKPEINRFYVDELRMRYKSSRAARREIEQRFVPVLNWLLKNGFSIPQAAIEQGDISFARVDQADQRIWDVVWSGFQALANIAYPMRYLGKQNDDGWEVGPVTLDWPSPHSFVSLFTRVASSSVVAETGRIPAFNYLDLRNQAVTDFSFGSVIYTEGRSKGSFSPNRWLPISLRACQLDGMMFYCSNLQKADLQHSSLQEAVLSNARLDEAILSFANLKNSMLVNAEMRSVIAHNADFTGSTMEGATIRDGNFEGSNLEGVFSSSMSATRGPTVFANTVLRKIKGTSVKFGSTVIYRCDVEGADFSGSDLSNTQVVDTDMMQALFDENTRAPENKVGSSDVGAKNFLMISLDNNITVTKVDAGRAKRAPSKRKPIGVDEKS